ncbi:MAG: hypothetical protein GXO27_00565 [Chlorobi bacterium]|nr:hypothetical protein [Chlorobiota bacterium]
MKTKGLIFLFTVFSWGVFAQQTDPMQAVENHIRRMDSINREMADFLRTHVAEILKSDSIGDRRALAEVIEEYENRWDYYLMSETEELRRQLGLSEGYRPEGWPGKGWRLIMKIPQEVHKEMKMAQTREETEEEDEVKPLRPYTETKFHIGFNNFPDPSPLTGARGYNYWRSRYFGFDLTVHIPLDRKKLANIYGGGGLLWSYLSPTDTRLYHVWEENKLELSDYGPELVKSKLRTFWIRVPVGMAYEAKSGWTAGVEVYGKFYGGSTQKLSVREGGDEYVVKQRGYFGQNRFVWGAGGFIGYNGVRIYFGTDFAPYFKDYDMRLISIGLLL